MCRNFLGRVLLNLQFCIESSWFVFKKKPQPPPKMNLLYVENNLCQCELTDGALSSADALLHFTHFVPELSQSAKESRRYNETVRALPGKAGSAPIY